MSVIDKIFNNDISTVIDKNGNLVQEHQKWVAPWNTVKTGRKFDNPITLIAKLTPLQWLLFISGWLAWTLDAFDFFSVSLSITALQTQFGGIPASDITKAITLTLLLRSVGAAIFGAISDCYGRKWILIVNILLLAILELGTGFVQTYSQFLAVRSLFGIAMGGIWGLSATSALENLPVECRGLFSGILQQGYAFGYMFAALTSLYMVPKSPYGWRSLFWLGSGLSFAVAIFRILLPDSKEFQQAEMDRVKGERTKRFLTEAKIMFKMHWVRIIYLFLLMTGFNFMSHSSQDLYPTYMQVSKGFSKNDADIATIIGSVGAIVGGTCLGWLSQVYGRRMIIIVACIIGGFLIPLWILPSGFGALVTGAFFIQFCVQGAWGPIPSHLQELSPPAFRALIPGLTYQLGNMVSSSASQIEATFGERLRLPNGQPDYGKVQGILLGVIFLYVIVLTFIGPEQHASDFGVVKATDGNAAGNDHVVDQEKVVSDSHLNSVRETSSSNNEEAVKSEE